jgi:hypothetical protein
VNNANLRTAGPIFVKERCMVLLGGYLMEPHVFSLACYSTTHSRESAQSPSIANSSLLN